MSTVTVPETKQLVSLSPCGAREPFTRPSFFPAFAPSARPRAPSSGPSYPTGRGLPGGSHRPQVAVDLWTVTGAHLRAGLKLFKFLTNLNLNLTNHTC